MNRHLISGALAVLLGMQACWLMGCGGGNALSAVPNPTGSQTSAQTGRATFTITWPTTTEAQTGKAAKSQRTRVVPANFKSVRISIASALGSVPDRVLPRPDQGNQIAATIDSVPLGTVTVTIKTLPNVDGTGVPLSQATTQVTIKANQTTQVTIVLASTIDHLDLPAPPTSIPAGQTYPLVVTAKDANNNVVLLPTDANGVNSTLSWTSKNPAIAAVDSIAGVVTGVSAGTAEIDVSESDSQKTAAVFLTVRANPSVTPQIATLTLGQQQPFTASVAGVSDPSVTWSVRETTGGSITANGVYTAPNAPGTYHVVATSVADPNQTAIATVTVAAGQGNFTFQ